MNTDKIYAESIVNEYSVKEASKVVALKKLDRKAKRGANIFAYSFGIIMSLVVGIGMYLSMRIIGDGLQNTFILGVIIGIIGLIGVGVNYPIYRSLLKKGKDKYAYEIIELAKEIGDAAE